MFSISPAAEAKLRAQATAAGLDVAVYAGRYLELLVEGKQSVAVAGESEDGPVAVSEDALADFIEDEIHQMRAERRECA